jgi:hypothetical protein
MEKTLRSIICLILLCGAAAGTASAGALLSIKPLDPVVAGGTVIPFTVEIADISDLYAWQFDVTFSSSVLAAQSETEGEFLSSGGNSTFFIAGTIDNPNGIFSATADTLEDPVDGISGSGVLLSLSFLATSPGFTDVTLDNVFLLDSLGNDISFTTSDTSVTVTPEPATWMLSGASILGLILLRYSRRMYGR